MSKNQMYCMYSDMDSGNLDSDLWPFIVIYGQTIICIVCISGHLYG